jgi:ABC-type transport system involved in multi-copper enzyme maturation permease subunit
MRLNPFFAIFRNEVLLNTRRVAPYLLMVLFGANAILWWGWGPAVRLGWATNSDYYITRNLQGFSFLLGLPIFNAVIMGDPVIRDFRLGINPLLFSKPITRGEYLFGKFCGSFFVLACCQAVFPLTLFLLQGFHKEQMIVQPLRVVPYFKHFLFFVVISHLALGCIYFTVGTLTRNAKIVYVLAVCFYPFYIAYQVIGLKSLPGRWATLLDPLLLNFGPEGGGFSFKAEYLNQLVIAYTPIMIANRVLVLLVVIATLAILALRFSTSERSAKGNFSLLNLSGNAGPVPYDVESQALRTFAPDVQQKPKDVPLPAVDRLNIGRRADADKLLAALAIEFRLLRDERSFIVLLPIAVALSTFELTFYRVVPDVSYSGTYASSTAQTMLLFLIGMIVFYTGEAMYRDRELKIEQLLWSTPSANRVFILSKFLAILAMSLSLIVLVSVASILIQLVRGHTPIDISAYVVVYGVVLVPSVIFLASASVSLNVLLRNKYLAYVVSIGVVAGLFYAYGVGYNHWLYNPLLYHLWSYENLVGGSNYQRIILLQRIYVLTISVVLMALAHVFFERKQIRRSQA